MTTPAAPAHLRRRGQAPASDGARARIFLAMACLWPLLIMVFFIGNGEPTAATASNDGSTVATHKAINPGLSFRKYMDRVDVMGYGPTHPRVAVVVIGDDRAKILASVESVFRNTDIDRLFIVCAVMDGVESDPQLVKELTAIDQGAVPHWHGLRPDLHKLGSAKDGDGEPHGKKIHVLFSKDKQGIAASRADAGDFISLLSKKHELAGIKSGEEDLILLMMRSGSELASPKWLSPVTSALIVPPPLLGVEDPTVALKVANAVSFGLEGAKEENQALSFDYAFAPHWVAPSAKDMALSDGDSFPSPVLAGVATAMRFATFLQLPAQDLSLKDEWLANLDLSLNLWLCADGIDTIKELTVEWTGSIFSKEEVPPNDAARFAAAWMDSTHSGRVFDAITTTHTELTHLEWDTMLAHAKGLNDFPAGLQNKCRTFKWYVDEVNSELSIDDDGDAVSGKVADAAIIAPVKKVADMVEETLGLPDKPLEIPKVVEEEEQMPPPPIYHKEQKMPQHPIDDTRLATIQKPKPVNIKYLDTSHGHKDHPHMGAKDADGNFGYVHDETALRKNPPAFEFAGLAEACDSRDNTYKMLTEQVSVDFAADEAAEKMRPKRDQIFCLVYTIEKSHDRIPYIRETWGPKCDGFMVGSTKTDASLGAVEIPHEGEEDYNNIWQKVRSMWSYIYDNYYDKYDWFHIGGDDLYLLVENLRLYLESEEIQTAQNGGIYLPTGDETVQTPLFLGRRFAYMGNMDDIFISGGSGYTMNKAALKLLVTDGLENYFPHAHTFSEDTMVARIFKKYGVFPYDTKDEAGGERYNPFQPGHHWGYRPPADISKDWYAKYSIDVKWGKEHCAKRSVAYHYVKGDVQKRLHALLYNLCPK